MDKALKQRLVGATVLIILAVIVLPMLLSGRSETLKQESRQIEVPSKPDELSIETRRFPVGIPGRPDTQARQEAEVPEQEEVALEAPVNPEPQDDPVEDSASDPVSSSVTNGTEPDPVVETPPAVATISLPAKQEETGQAPFVDDQAVDNPRYLVQVASFSSEKRANALAQRLRENGLQVLMDVVDRTAGRLHRVRVGPYARRAEADAVVDRLGDEMSELDLAPRVLDLRPGDTAPVTTPSDPLVRWVVQVGSFGSSEKADALVARLRGGALPAFSEQVTSSGGTAYKVRVGPEISREAAVELMRKVKREYGLGDSFVTTTE